jgi:hypothetical protein
VSDLTNDAEGSPEPWPDGFGSVTLVRLPKASIAKVFHFPAGSVTVTVLPQVVPDDLSFLIS